MKAISIRLTSISRTPKCVRFPSCTTSKKPSNTNVVFDGVARLPRLERGAFHLGGERSIQLSYRRI